MAFSFITFPPRSAASSASSALRGLIVQYEIDLARLAVDAHELHAHAVADAETLGGALAEQLVFARIEMEIIGAEFRYVHQPFHKYVVERDKNSECDRRADGAGKRFAHPVAHEVTLEPRIDVARRLVGAPFRLRAMRAEFLPAAGRVVLATQHGLDCAMHQQIGIAPDRRSEMRIRLVGKPEMADVVRAVDRSLSENRAAPGVFPRSAPRARDTASDGRGRAESPRRRHWPPACIPRSRGARRCAAPARCARSCRAHRTASAFRSSRNRSRRAWRAPWRARDTNGRDSRDAAGVR